MCMDKKFYLTDQTDTFNLSKTTLDNENKKTKNSIKHTRFSKSNES